MRLHTFCRASLLVPYPLVLGNISRIRDRILICAVDCNQGQIQVTDALKRSVESGLVDRSNQQCLAGREQDYFQAVKPFGPIRRQVTINPYLIAAVQLAPPMWPDCSGEQEQAHPTLVRLSS